MKRIAKKAVSLFLALYMMVFCGVTAMAAQTDARQTSFFPHNLYHIDQDFSGLEYKHIEAGPILEEIKNIRELLGDAANAAEVERMFWEVDDQLLELMTMQGILTIRAYLDVNDEESADALAYVEQTLGTLEDAVFALARDILGSPCAAFLKEALNEDQIRKYLEYGEMDPDLLTLMLKENELSVKASALLSKTYTAGYDGAEWTLNSVDEALSSGKITQESADAIWMCIRAAKNEELGNLYLELLAVRRDITRAKGYASYPEYSYKEVHLRDYTPGEVDRLYADIKEYIVPLYKKVEACCLAYEAENPEVFNRDYVGTGDSFLKELLEPYIARVSSEMQESFTYMREHHLYDIGLNDSKLPVSFSAPIQTYGAAFYFQSPHGNLRDFSTAVHEFGHYNNTYYDCFDPNQHYVTYQDDCTDTSEVHSQGFELIFSHFYPEIFGKDANIVDISLHCNLLKAILLGALYDEFQQYAYGTQGVTLEQLNRKYSELAEAYGVSPTAREGGAYRWVDISHTFLQPCYYISHATSAAGAYTFWNAAQSDYFGAVDKYLQFVALDSKTGFQSSFKAVGMTNPLSDGYLKELSETLYEKLDLSADTNSPSAYFTLTAGGTALDISKFSTMSYADAEAIACAVEYSAEGATVPVLASVEDPADGVVIGYPVVDGVPVYDEESHTGANVFVDVTPENTVDNPVYVAVKYIPNKEGATEAKPYDEYFKIALYMAPAASVQPVSVNPTNDKLEVDGKAQSPAAYKINDYNYFKLRDIAALLNGTGKQFSVGYDSSTGTVTLTSGQPYEVTDSDLAALPAESRQATASANMIYINGVSAQLTVYNIDGYNYFKLRDLASALDFYVGWTAERGMFLESGRPYSA